MSRLTIAIGVVLLLLSFGCRRTAMDRSVEARNTVRQLTKNAVAAYELGADPFADPLVARMCPSASKPVPADRFAISGKTYTSSAAEWRADEANKAGFACLHFEMSAPQRYQYEYVADETSFTVRAWGDLDGNGVYSKFETHGVVDQGHVRIDPNITETMPDE